MLTDTHCHPYDLVNLFVESEQERRRLGVLAAASACSIEELTHNEELARNAVLENSVPLLPCFGIHPQFFKIMNDELTGSDEQVLICSNLLETLYVSAFEGRLSAVGEFGFDLYNAAFRETEASQDRIFVSQMETAIRFNLPVVIHARRAINKIFAHIKPLAKCKSVVFHSWSGTLEEALSILRRGVNAYFSFGNTVMLNHKQAMHSCALLPAQRLLTETDAPYQPRRGKKISCWADLPLILEAVVSLRTNAGNNISVNDLEMQIEANFRRVFGLVD